MGKTRQHKTPKRFNVKEYDNKGFGG